MGRQDAKKELYERMQEIFSVDANGDLNYLRMLGEVGQQWFKICSSSGKKGSIIRQKE
jgi:hypothetical protein